MSTITEKIKPTPTAEKMLSIIAGFFNLRKGEIRENHTWYDLNINEKERDRVLDRIACRFCIPVGDLIEVNFPDPKTNKHIKGPWPEQKAKIKTIYNVLQFIESNDSGDGKPAAYKLQ